MSEKTKAEDKAEEYKRRLEAHDAEDAKIAKMFDPQELVREASTIREKVHPKFGVVRYGVLTIDDLFTLDKISDRNEKAKTMLWLMLKKAYPDLKKEDIGKFPGVEASELISFLLSDATDFLAQTGRASKSGFVKTQQHRK